MKNSTFNSGSPRNSHTIVFIFMPTWKTTHFIPRNEEAVRLLYLPFMRTLKRSTFIQEKPQTLTLFYTTLSATLKLQVSFKSTEKQSHHSIPLSGQDQKSKFNSTPPRDNHTIVFHFQRNIASQSWIQQHRETITLSYFTFMATLETPSLIEEQTEPLTVLYSTFTVALATESLIKRILCVNELSIHYLIANHIY